MQDADYIDDTIREYREMREGKFYEFGSMIVYCLENYFQIGRASCRERVY